MTAAEAVPIQAARADARGQEFAVVYRANVGAVSAYFARRCREPQEVADLTSQAFVEVLGSVHTYAGRGSVRAWLIAIAAAAAIAITALSGSAPAYALTRNANGTITLSIYQWTRVNIGQINARFASMGSRWRVVPVTASCRTPWPPRPDYGYTIVSGAKTGTVTPGPTLAAFPGVWVIAAGQRPDGQIAFATFSMARPMPSCLPPAALVPSS